MRELMRKRQGGLKKGDKKNRRVDEGERKGWAPNFWLQLDHCSSVTTTKMSDEMHKT